MANCSENTAVDLDREQDLTDEEILVRDDRAAVQALIEELGVDAALRLIQAYSGTRIYVPKWIPLPLAVRNEQIREEFNVPGVNHRDLCQKYDLTESQIRKILNHNPDQLTRFESEEGEE